MSRVIEQLSIGVQYMSRCSHAIIVAVLAAPVVFADWPSSGGNERRNGQSSELGPTGLDVLWSGGRSSVIAWQPVIEGRRVFMVRQLGFPPEPLSNLSPVVAMNLDTGAELWHFDVPFQAGDWTTWVAGVKNGRVFACRGGNGASSLAKVFCLDAATGSELWQSVEEVDAGFYDGVVFSADGDPIIGSFRYIWRIDAETGATVWRASRTCSVSGNCGVAINADAQAVYAVDTVAGGQAVRKFDLLTGAFLYRGPTMPGFLTQSTPMVGPDGAIYFNRAQTNDTVDFFYAFEDNGTAITEKWHVPSLNMPGAEFGVGPDGSVYMVDRQTRILRLNPADGSIVNNSNPIPSDFHKSRFAFGDDGLIYYSNGSFDLGRLYCFSTDLVEQWSTPVFRVNIGGPALGADGTLVICGVGSDLRAYRSARLCAGDVDGDGDIDLTDLATLLANFGLPSGATRGQGDLDADGDIDLADLATLLANFGGTCS